MRNATKRPIAEWSETDWLISIHARIPYHRARACSGDKSVTISHASDCHVSPNANRVHANGLSLKQTTCPHYCVPAFDTTDANR